MEYRGKIALYKYVSGGYPCEGWIVTLSVWDGNRQLSLQELAKNGDRVVVSAAEMLAEMYGDDDDPPEAFFTDATWSSVETDLDEASSMLDSLGESGWTIVRDDTKDSGASA